jgi:ribonuclease HI
VKELDKIIVYGDGALLTNPGRAGIGATGRQIWEDPSFWGSKLFRPEKTSKTNGRIFFGSR